MIERIRQNFTESIQTTIAAADAIADAIAKAGEMLVHCLLDGHKILICGNGGSAAQAQQFAAELLNRFERERPSLPAIALSGDGVSLTAIAQDYQFSEIFAKQIRALGQAGDILVVLSTSGNARNLLQAMDAALSRDMLILALTSHDGGEVAGLVSAQDCEIRVPSNSTARSQEVQLLILHCLSDYIDRRLFGQETP